MFVISSVASVFDVKNVPDTGARLVIQPGYSNTAFRTEPTFQQDFPTATDALIFVLGHIGKSVIAIVENQHVSNIVTGGTFYVDINTPDATRESFCVVNNSEV